MKNKLGFRAITPITLEYRKDWRLGNREVEIRLLEGKDMDYAYASIVYETGVVALAANGKILLVKVGERGEEDFSRENGMRKLVERKDVQREMVCALEGAELDYAYACASGVYESVVINRDESSKIVSVKAGKTGNEEEFKREDGMRELVRYKSKGELFNIPTIIYQ